MIAMTSNVTNYKYCNRYTIELMSIAIDRATIHMHIFMYIYCHRLIITKCCDRDTCNYLTVEIIPVISAYGKPI